MCMKQVSVKLYLGLLQSVEGKIYVKISFSGYSYCLLVSEQLLLLCNKALWWVHPYLQSEKNNIITQTQSSNIIFYEDGTIMSAHASCSTKVFEFFLNSKFTGIPEKLEHLLNDDHA